MEKKQKKERKKVVAVKSKSATEIERLSMKKKMERKRIEGVEHTKKKLKYKSTPRGNNRRNYPKRHLEKGKKVQYITKQNEKR